MVPDESFRLGQGRSFTVYLLASLIVSWVVPLIAVLVLPDRRKLA
jgi:hypothetical protein